MTVYPKITLKPGKEIAVKRFHPWIFTGAIDRLSGKVKEGDLVEIQSSTGEFLAIGHALAGSIAVKILSFEPTTVDRDFWRRKLQAAYALRKLASLTDNPETNAYRLVFGEGDHLPGLVIDHFAGVLILQAHTVGVYLAFDEILEVLKELYGESLVAVYSKSADALSRMSGFEATDGFLFGDSAPEFFLENGIRYKLDLTGQKTGFFCDQREHRKLLAHYASGKKVLDMFCYSGGFTLNAIQAGAGMLVSVDSSKSAAGMVTEHITMNGFPAENQQTVVADAKQYLDKMEEGFDLIVLDPPAFAKHQSMRTQGMKGYRTINAAAIKKINKGGILFTFSCSQAIDKESFRSAVTAAAIDAGREVRIIHQLVQPPDHPVNLFHQEGEYLKGLVLVVE
jgi:23S rRNA (cytosine1962-C5)-methyltransferase